jgi:uncharacterized protein YlxP (DUF503 family)
VFPQLLSPATALSGAAFEASREVRPMHIALVQVELRIPGSHSLKNKRGVMKRLINIIRSRHNVAVAEIGKQDAWKSAQLGLVTINTNGENTDRILQRVIREIGHFDGCELEDYRIERF